ncbi:MAG: alpha/beta hydrolase [Jatrophihabitans sp.]|uniref:alpha/beta hydrolase n=1 Tax=Jatrophihabitans sp. TaxID=1932789 RepID=UPI003914CCB2
MTISRRAALAGGLAAVALAGCSGSGPSAGTAVHGSFVSRRRGGARTPWTVLSPPGHDRARLPVLVVLHGRGGDQNYAYRTLHFDRYLAEVVGAGAPPFAIAAPYGGDHDYWHPRRGTDPAGMVVDEFLPLLAARGLDVARVGLLGWSMGGYGALYLAGVLGRSRCAVAVAESPAIWHHSYQSVRGAFDDAGDFDRHAVLARLGRLAGIPLRIDCGSSDGFAPVTRDLRAGISPTPAGGIEPGGHNPAYWRSQARAQLAFAAQNL